MSVYQWFIFFLLVQIVHFLGTWKLYESAGRKRWEAAIPVYNAIVLMKIIGRPTWWTILPVSWWWELHQNSPFLVIINYHAGSPMQCGIKTSGFFENLF